VILTQMRQRKVVEAQLSQRDAMLVALGDLVSADSCLKYSWILRPTSDAARPRTPTLRAEDEPRDVPSSDQSITRQLLATLREDAVRAVRIDRGDAGSRKGRTPGTKSRRD